MAAETLTGTRAVESFPVFQNVGAGNLAVAYGTYAVASNVEDGDIFKLCKIPAGAVIVGGFFTAADLDTGAESIDLDLGWAANGSDAADPDGLGNFGVLTGDAVAGYKPEVGTLLPVAGTLMTGTAFPTFAKETTIQVEANAAAATFAAGTIKCAIYYVVP